MTRACDLVCVTSSSGINKTYLIILLVLSVKRIGLRYIAMN